MYISFKIFLRSEKIIVIKTKVPLILKSTQVHHEVIYHLMKIKLKFE